MKRPTNPFLEPLKTEESVGVVTHLTGNFFKKTDKIIAFLIVLILQT